MKQIITILLLILIPFAGYSQNKTNKNEDVKITVNISKISKTLGGVVKFIVDDAKQFKDEAAEGFTEEEKAELKQIKEDFINELKECHKSIHEGWKAGWKGEPYTPKHIKDKK